MSLLQEILWESSSSDEEHEIRRKRKVYLPRVDRFAKWDDDSFLERFRVSKNLARALSIRLEEYLIHRTTK